ncbi:hypothetical protein CJU89_4433 [Yarrowia sp. B02]|nr:hypothetical protein CJU89_4433 [Yarrowia sp. B02]
MVLRLQLVLQEDRGILSFGVPAPSSFGKLLGKIPDFDFSQVLLAPPEAQKTYVKYCSDGRVFSSRKPSLEHLDLGIVPRPVPKCRCEACVVEYLPRYRWHESTPLLETVCSIPPGTPTPVKLEGVDFSAISEVTLFSNGMAEVALKKGVKVARGRWLTVKVGRTKWSKDARLRSLRGNRAFKTIGGLDDYKTVSYKYEYDTRGPH